MEDSKAIEETAKAIGKGIDVADNVGTFIDPLIKRSLNKESVSEDKFKICKMGKTSRLMCRATEFMKNAV